MDSHGNKKLKFVAAKKGENLSTYKEILDKVYLKNAEPGYETYIQETIAKTYPILISWIGNKGNRFMKILDGEQPIGFLTVAALDEDETNI